MKQETYRNLCACQCHGKVTIHATIICDCGKQLTPPPFKTPNDPTPPWTQGKPQPGDPSEVPWFRGQDGQVQRKGPRFGPRKDEYLPYLLIRTASGDRGARPFT